jgi:hypothetical protein
MREYFIPLSATEHLFALSSFYPYWQPLVPIVADDEAAFIYENGECVNENEHIRI